MTRLVLLPGLVCDASVWAHARAALTARADIHVAHYGTLDSLDSLGAMAEKVLAEVDGPCALAGHSMGGRIAFPLGSLYHGTKFAVEGLSESLHYELRALGIRVKVIEPGMINTDFGGRSFDFNNDPALPEYQPIVRKLTDTFGSLMKGASAPERIAEVIHGAVTDESDRLRYEAGPDAEQALATRKAADDATFMAGVRSQFGLA